MCFVGGGSENLGKTVNTGSYAVVFGTKCVECFRFGWYWNVDVVPEVVGGWYGAGEGAAHFVAGAILAGSGVAKLVGTGTDIGH